MHGHLPRVRKSALGVESDRVTKLDMGQDFTTHDFRLLFNFKLQESCSVDSREYCVVAARCQVYKKCTKIDFGWGSAGLPQTQLSELTTLPRPYSCIKEALLLREGKGRDVERD